jgi:hypothetical protein
MPSRRAVLRMAWFDAQDARMKITRTPLLWMASSSNCHAQEKRPEASALYDS